jgi:hypothetical protein
MSTSFALNADGSIVHVNEVPRGLACHCRCIACSEAVLARQGEVREHHFAHTSGKDPCDVSYESVLHQFAKRLILEAGRITVPAPPSVVEHFGLDATGGASTTLAFARIDLEKTYEDIRPDLLAFTDLGTPLAIEVAYSSFCDFQKRDRFSALGLAALEIDLRQFDPETFEVDRLRAAVVVELHAKTWLWPRPTTPIASFVGAPTNPPGPKPHLAEDIVDFSGRWVSIKTLPYGDVAVKAVSYDPDLVSVIRTIASENGGRYKKEFRNWIIPKWRADIVRAQLRKAAEDIQIKSAPRRT